MTLIIGSNGSMGKRYQAILRHLGEEYLCVDMDNVEDLTDYLAKSDRAIIATPTKTHLNFISLLAPYKIPVLCEKPLTTSRDELLLIENIKHTHDMELNMTMQYECLDTQGCKGMSHYNYFRHGNDGLYWDCLQVIGLHRGEMSDISVEETSPIWTCALNGVPLSLSDMDQAYVLFVQKWLCGAIYQPMDYLVEIHERVRRLEKKNGNKTI